MDDLSWAAIEELEAEKLRVVVGPSATSNESVKHQLPGRVVDGTPGDVSTDEPDIDRNVGDQIFAPVQQLCD